MRMGDVRMVGEAEYSTEGPQLANFLLYNGAQAIRTQ